MLFTFEIVIALGLDLLFGDPRWMYHPVRVIGLLCERFEAIGRRLFGYAGMRICGLIVFSAVLLVSLTGIFLILAILFSINHYLGAAAALFMLYLSLAAGDLIDHSNRVYQSLTAGKIGQARNDVAMLVARETEFMEPQDISRACVESVAENFVDGIVAPLFYAVLFALLFQGIFIEPIVWGVVGAYFYKSVNTMDSMFGYKNERYLYFGWAAARADDLLNFIPARVGAFTIVVTAFILSLDYRNSFKTVRSDHANSSSPNSGYPEAAVSGALNIRLGGEAVYFGERIEGFVIGETYTEVEADDIKRVNHLCFWATWVFVSGLILLYNLLERGVG